MGASVSSAMARRFRPAGLASLPPGAAAAPPLTVVSYNILANKWATAPGGQHAYCPPQYLAWPYRSQLLIRELLGFQADILCLQEVERPWFEQELEGLLKRQGYEALYYARRRRPQDPPAVPEDGLALIYRADRLERKASKAMRLADCLEPRLRGKRRLPCTASWRGKFWSLVRQREDAVVLALLKDRHTGRHLLSACTHLFWDPRFPDVKAAQASLLCRAVARFLRQQPALRGAALRQIADAMPLVVCGDFNSLPRKRRSDTFDTVPPGQMLTSGVYQLLSDEAGIGSTHHDHPARRMTASRPNGPAASRAEAAQLACLRLARSPLALQSAAAAAWGREPPVTNKTASFAGTLDYVWLSRGHWAVGAALELPYRWGPPVALPPGAPPGAAADGDPEPEAVSDLPPIPSQHFPSDHLALGFRLHMLPPQV